MVTEFTKSVVLIIGQIPHGKVLSYGKIAKLAGHPRAARQVTRILNSCTKKYDLPWHRVVSSKGEILIKDTTCNKKQKSLLKAEGIKFSKNQINLSKYLWDISSMEDLVL